MTAVGKENFIAVTGAVRDYLLSLSESGCEGFDCSEKSLEIIGGWNKKPSPKTDTLETIRADIGDCKRCGLHKGRKNIVFGAGDPNAKLVFVGEGPGRDEDLAGEPFVGPAGQLLTKIIQAITLTREQVYICNVVKCRPPQNRNPLPDEIAACRPFLERQIAAVKPDFIVGLGAFAAQTLLNTTESISRLRGRFHNCMGARLMPTFHPAYLLKNPERKRETWEDMKKLMSACGLRSGSP